MIIIVETFSQEDLQKVVDTWRLAFLTGILVSEPILIFLQSQIPDDLIEAVDTVIGICGC